MPIPISKFVYSFSSFFPLSFSYCEIMYSQFANIDKLQRFAESITKGNSWRNFLIQTV